ncbi:cyclic-di-AMP-binding protein CbpB [Brevibacillus daliensis]|uniref:cyclic-di-AMP-binding protein CbpB n=1 Tax=Brevibacillus daliensis TaxID=2892995 RepID=UPI001E58CA38|nr:cyclic-di-AMP-binding protein CbpB [Brevibacillus daliensis]
MINPQAKDILEQSVKDLVIPGSKVAHVQLGNSLEHALLVLVKTRYSSIPVLDSSYKVMGLISKTMILESIFGLERIEYEKLSEHRVEEVMDTKIPHLRPDDTFIRALELTINHPFICIEDDQGVFLGILTRKTVLALVYHHFRTENK